MIRRTALLLFLALPVFAADYTVKPLPLPGANADGIGMDYIAYEPSTNSVWVPAGNTAAVDVIDVATGKIAQITGFATKEITFRGRKHTVGPSAVAFGGKTAYIGNRGDSSVCAVDIKTHKLGHCEALVSAPDGIAYVPNTEEVWVTTPRDKSIRILDAKTLHEKSKLTFDGGPEGFAVDAKRGRFYTNLEDKDVTLAIDIKSQKTVARWKLGCGQEGPRGLRADVSNGNLFVACTMKVETLDATHNGAVISSVETGPGVDDLDFHAQTRMLYAAAGRAGKLTIAKDDGRGKLSVVATVPTPTGARNAAVAANGNVYVPHSAGSEIVVVTK